MYDQVTANEWVIGLLVSIVVFSIAAHIANRYVKRLSQSTNDAAQERYIYQYGNTSMPAANDADVKNEKPDIDASNAGMPHISAYLTEREFIILLAAQKLPNNKYRLTANKIYDIVSGDRNAVLKIIGEIRSQPNYRKLDENLQPVVDLESE